MTPVPEHDSRLFINRELSWLAFNERVLEEAADRTTPLLDRARFAAITASNLDEFFMVRVAGLEQAVADGDLGPDLAGLTAAQQLEGANATAARGPLQAFQNEVRALARSGRMAQDEADALTRFSGWVLAALH